MLTDQQITALRTEAETNAEFRLLVRGGNGVPANDVAAAAMASTLMPKQVTQGSFYTELGIIAAFSDPAAGETLLQTLATVAASGPEHAVLARMLKWLAPGMPGLDFGNAALRAAINAYHTAEVLTTTQRDTLLALGERAVVVSASDIARVR
jgi:hypothetical protein